KLTELDRAGDAVQQGNTIEQRARGDRTEHEVLHRRFRRLRRVAVERDHRAERERLHLEAEVQNEQVVARYHDHDAEQSEQAEDEELALEEAPLLEKIA